jgi:leucyl aminopeptidase
MQFQVTTAGAQDQRTDCLILPVYSDGGLPASTRAVDRATDGLVSELADAGDLRGRAGETLLAHPRGKLAAKRLLLVGCGSREKFDRETFRKAATAVFQALQRSGSTSAVSYLAHENAKGADAYRRASICAELWHNTSYRYTATKSKNGDDDASQASLKRFTIACTAKQAAAARRGLKHGDAIGAGMSLARELGDLPPNVCTPNYLVQQARKLARGVKQLSLDVLDEAEMKKLGMGSLLSVTAGTSEPAKFMVFNYRGSKRKNARPVALVGKGITFDAGGISLKPPPQMDEMKWDMCGAATVFGVIKAVTALGPGINLVGIVPACENLPSGTATRPGDIVTAMSGETIEILNTDAEGRLILADAMTYAQRFKPSVMIDIATLTGACIIALGRHRSGLMSNSDKLAGALMKAGERADDRAWQLPLDAPYMRQLKSRFADVANIGGREAGTITAGCFLSRFAGDTDWAHLDIAGTAWRQGAAKGGTGRPVPLLMEYLLNG